MGILDRVTERFGRDDHERRFECLRCGVGLDVEYHSCPECGSFSIDRRSFSV